MRNTSSSKVLRTQSTEGETFEPWVMDTVFSRLKSSLKCLLPALKDTSQALPPVSEVMLYVLNGVAGLPAVLCSMEPVLLGTA